MSGVALHAYGMLLVHGRGKKQGTDVIASTNKVLIRCLRLVIVGSNIR
jgi:hypothetical protein